ncbi:MAG: UPF0280 family protein [Atribacterota bacterium]|nr:UPF0280 family protein [Atribacterota bacterium]MDD4895951.1 UPF0280 family protein [Atribacterota bacterium]MDD5636724.1 UPF0280 family protein [Atribacterota bacterium]
MKKQDFLNQYNFDPGHSIRSYRKAIKSSDLVSFPVKEKESDLLIQAPVILEEEALASLKYYRSLLEDYIKENPLFRTTLTPYPFDNKAHPMIREMIEVSTSCQVGPMASVAGCIAQNVAQDLLTRIDEVIIENGGDLYIKSSSLRRVIIYAGSSPLSNKLYLKIDSRKNGLGICTSSGTVGPSFSMGKADAVTVISYSASLADAAATAIGNIIQTKEDIRKALNLVQCICGLRGVVIIKDDKIGMWGEIDYGLT